MATLSYHAMASLDGYVADSQGKFDWAEPDEEVHRFVNELERPIGTYLYGRRLYETMAAWDVSDAFAGQLAYVRDFAAIWQGAEKIVYSRTMQAVRTKRTRLEREFDVDAVRVLKTTSQRGLTVGGPHLAAAAINAGLVDECNLFLVPVVVGSGNAAFGTGVTLRLELLEQRRFRNGTVFMRYRLSR